MTSLIAAILFVFASMADAKTLYSAIEGIDSAACGPRDAPCRSISRTIANAAAGDEIVVGPGRYGDLDGNGMLTGFGEETPAPGCGCMLAVNKSVSVVSSHGAASTVIDAHSANVLVNVLLILDAGEFGRPGRGFTVTNTLNDDGAGIAIDSQNLAVRGNQILVVDGTSAARRGILTVAYPETILIEANQVIGWFYGIRVQGAGNVVRKNHLSLNKVGIDAIAGEIVGNVVTAGETGMGIYSTTQEVAHNAVHANREVGFVVYGAPAGDITKNNLIGNRCGMIHSIDGLVATDNYWGAPSGPGDGVEPEETPGDDVCAPGVTTTVTPFATKPFNVRAPIKP